MRRQSLQHLPSPAKQHFPSPARGNHRRVRSQTVIGTPLKTGTPCRVANTNVWDNMKSIVGSWAASPVPGAKSSATASDEAEDDAVPATNTDTATATPTATPTAAARGWRAAKAMEKVATLTKDLARMKFFDRQTRAIQQEMITRGYKQPAAKNLRNKSRDEADYQWVTTTTTTTSAMATEAEAEAAAAAMPAPKSPPRSARSSTAASRRRRSMTPSIASRLSASSTAALSARKCRTSHRPAGSRQRARRAEMGGVLTPGKDLALGGNLMRLLGTAAEMIIGGTAENTEMRVGEKDEDTKAEEGKKVKATEVKVGEMKAAAKVAGKAKTKATVVNAVGATDATAAAAAVAKPLTAAVTRALVLEDESAKDATETKDSCSGDSGNGADGYDGGGETKTSAAAPTMSSTSMSSASAVAAVDKPTIVAPLSARNKLLERVQGGARSSGRHRRKSSTVGSSGSVGSPADSSVGSSLAGSPADSPFLLSSSESSVADSPASDCWPSPSNGASIKIALIQHGKNHPNGTPMALPPLASTPPGAAESNTEGKTEAVVEAAPVAVVAVEEKKETEFEEKKAAENVEEKVGEMAEKAIMMQPMSPAMSPAVITTVDLGPAVAVAPATYDSTAVSSSSSSSSRMQPRGVPAEEPRAALPHRVFGDDVVGGWLMEQGGVSKMQQHIDGIERAPWVRDEEVDACMCVVCPDQTPFSLFNRRHHCRSCGYVVCGDCSAHRGTVNGYGASQRICTGCWEELEMLGGPPPVSSAPPSEASMSWREFEQDFADDSCGCAMM